MDFDIQTISDLFSILFKMENQANLKINTMQELDAASSEDTLFLHFQNNYINQVLKTYYSSAKSIKNIDTQHQNTALAEIQNRLLDNNTSIHSDTSTLSDVSVNPVLPLSSADQTWLDLSSDCTEEEKKEMLKAAAFTKNCLHHSSK